MGQVNIAVAEMGKVTQQNAASSEESASASEELIAQAEQMKVFAGDLVNLIGNGKKKFNRLNSKDKTNIPNTKAIPSKVTNKQSAYTGSIN